LQRDARMIESKSNHRVPVAAKTLGMWLFLAALTMLFAATLLAYFLIRNRGSHAGEVHLPRALLLSTACMLLGSFTIHHAVLSARRERQSELRRDLVMTCIFAATFLVIQTPAMIGLLKQHQHLATQNIRVYGLIFFLILIHALHVLGGVLGLAITTYHAYRDAYDHENYAGVKHAAMYWHFLDVVWLVMYAGIYIAG
jgi:heme/copper-type cytochrome/quinol oxidase subunit 3